MSGGIGRLLEAAVPLEEHNTLVEVAHLGEELVDGDQLCARVEGGDEGLVLHVEAGEDVGDQLAILKRLARNTKLIRKQPHVCEVRRHGLCPLLRIGEGDTYVVDAGQGL